MMARLSAAWLALGWAVTATATTPSMGCGEDSADGGTRTIEHNGIERTYRVLRPEQGGAPAPVILVFHGWGGNENEFLQDATVATLARERGYLVAAPRGLGSEDPDQSFNSWSFRGSTTGLDGDGLNALVSGDSTAICDDSKTPNYAYPSCADIRSNTCSWTHCQVDDVEFAVDLLKQLGAEYCVDLDHVYAVGGSNGGMFTWELAQNPKSAPLLRAIAPVIGLPHRGYLNPPGKSGPLPALLITGLEDEAVPPGAWEDDAFTTTSNGSDRYFYTGASAIMRTWSEAHNCSTQAPARPFESASANADCRTYCESEGGWPVVLDCRAPMGHTYAFEWSWGLILDFFDAHAASQTD